MPSLEILDIGRNKIKRLPTQPGSLVNLRVFSFYRNKITRLPSYLVKFIHLSILRAEQNPWEWPPKRLMETQSPTKDFIKSIQHWIEDNAPSEQRNLTSDSTMREELGLESRR
jgi:Leucine-rich repeat (LRR) protein